MSSAPVWSQTPSTATGNSNEQASSWPDTPHYGNTYDQTASPLAQIAARPAAHVETGFVRTYTGVGDEGQLVAHTAMLYRVAAIAADADVASLLAKVREQMDTFLVDYL